MAKKSKIAKEKKIEATIAKYAPLHAKYKAEHNYAALQALPRNASPVRAHRWSAACVHAQIQNVSFEFP